MVAVGEHTTSRQHMKRAVAERDPCGAYAMSTQDRVMRSSPKCQQATQLRHHTDFLGKESVACMGLGGCRQVGRWNTADSVGDSAIHQDQPVSWVRSISALRQAEMQQRPIEQFSGKITSEWPSGPVGAAHTGCQTNDQQLCFEAAETGNRAIEPVRMRCAIRVPVLRKPRTDRTISRRRRAGA